MKVIIVEDEFLAQQELSGLLTPIARWRSSAALTTASDVLKFLQHNKVDAIFLDINIPSLDGVLLAQNISQFAHKPLSSLSPRGKNMRWKPLSWKPLTTS